MHKDFMGNKINVGDYLAYQIRGWTGLVVCKVLDLVTKKVAQPGNGKWTSSPKYNDVQSIRVIFTGRKRTSMITEHERRAVLVREIDLDINIWLELTRFARSRS